MSDPKPLCVAHIELGAHLYGGAQQVLYLLGELSRTEVRSVLICPCLLYTSPSPRDLSTSRMPSSA